MYSSTCSSSRKVRALHTTCMMYKGMCIISSCERSCTTYIRVHDIHTYMYVHMYVCLYVCHVCKINRGTMHTQLDSKLDYIVLLDNRLYIIVLLFKI